MSDLLLENAYARTAVRSLGLPLPLPEPLERGDGPWEERPLEGERVLVGAAPNGALGEILGRSLVHAGAKTIVDGPDELFAKFREPGEATGRSPERAPRDGADSVRALAFDASGVSTIADLEVLYRFLHEWVGRLARSGRIVVLARPVESAPDEESAAARRALEGLVRSLAKEVGRRGSTANLLFVDEGAEERAEGVLRFVLSKRSAFVSGQPFRVTTRARGSDAVSWTRPLDQKVALVTGAARGIGAATATRLAEEGAHVVCLDRPEDGEPAGRLAREIGGSVLLVDVASADAPERIARELRERHGGVHVVVHNAGVTRDKTLAKMDASRWGQVLGINLEAPVRVTRALRDGVLRDGGRIVCLSSVSGIAGNVGQSNYSASKAGLIGFVRHEAEALADRGITVNAVAPGFIETRMTAEMPLFVREAGRRLSALGQGGQPEDVAEGITFLATPWASGITGSVVRICGGAYVGA